MHLIDSHCHLDFPDFDADRHLVLQQCRMTGVHQLVLAAISKQHWGRLWQLIEHTQSPRLYGTLGLHPYFLHAHQPKDLVALRQQLERYRTHPRLCAVGEIGLDFQLPGLDRDSQLFYFDAQLKLARAFSLPVILHVRKAHNQVLEQLKAYKHTHGGIVHAFSGSYEQAQEYIRLGFLLGIGGAYTWANARKLRALLPRLPLSSLALETDSPDMTPAFSDSPRNNPANLRKICEELAKIYGVSAEQFAKQSTLNVQRVLILKQN